MDASEAFFGSPTHRRDVEERLSGLIAANQVILDACKKILYRPPVLKTAAEGVLFIVGRQCYQDFLDILLLCGNGRGAAALRLVRSLFEKTVTATYIITHPDEAQWFEKYDAVHQYKLLERSKTLKRHKMEALLDRQPQITEAYKTVKDDFQITNCKKCGTKRLQPSWSKLDIAAMCSKIDPAFEELYFSCYLYPTLHLHSTFYSLRHILERAGNKNLIEEIEPQEPNLLTMALSYGCSIMMQILHAHDHQFALGMGDELAACHVALEKGWAVYRAAETST